MVPYLVNATGGSTVLGAYDPLDEIATICQKYGIWLHVDGAWGASVLFKMRIKVH
jgi:glutamate/tyrosine decarboxylase-like PLP-dependent enzyme